jgi:hypothetical protein
MTRFSRRTVPLFGLSAGLTCLATIGCGGDEGTDAPVSNDGAAAPGATPSTPGGAAPGGVTPAPGTATPGGTTPGTMTEGGPTPGSVTPVASPTTPDDAPTAPEMDTPAPRTSSVLEYHGNAKRDGNFVDPAFTRAAAANLKRDTAFNATVTGDMYAQPLYFENGPGGKDVVITVTEANEVTAFDASNGSIAWRRTLGPAAQNATQPCGNINPLGITGTPVIDAASRTLFVADVETGPANKIYALSLDDGSVDTGWPVTVDNIQAGGHSFVNNVHNQRGALLIVGDMLYVPYGGRFGDCGDYHGWVIGVPMDNPAAPVAFATAAHAGGIWAPGGLASDGTYIYAATGNTMSDNAGILSTPSTWGHGNAILRLGRDLETIPESQTADFFAAQNWQALDRADQDLGGSGPVLFDVAGATPSQLALALGKDGAAYLLDRADLGGMGGEIARLVVSGNTIIQAAAAYTTPSGTFVAFRGTANARGCQTGSGALGAIKVTAGSPPSIALAWCAGPTGNFASPIVTTTDGTSESIVWYGAGANLLAYNGEDGTPVFTGMNLISGRTAKFQTPIVAKGRLFFATANEVLAFTLE